MHVQMDRSWVHSTLFSTEYVNGVKEFMDFIKEKYVEDDQILCPCTRCLNQKYLHQPNVKNHILMNGMDYTYTRWVHHGEDISVLLMKSLLLFLFLTLMSVPLVWLRMTTMVVIGWIVCLGTHKL